MDGDEKSVSIDRSTNVEMMARLKKWGCFIVGDSTRGTLAVSLQQDITLAVAEGEHILPVLNNDHAQSVYSCQLMRPRRMVGVRRGPHQSPIRIKAVGEF